MGADSCGNMRLPDAHELTLPDAARIALQPMIIRQNKEINEKHKKIVDKCKKVCYDKAIKSKEEPTDG